MLGGGGGGGGGEPLKPSPAFAPVGKWVSTQINYLKQYTSRREHIFNCNQQRSSELKIFGKEYSMNQDLWTVKILKLHELENIFLSVARKLLLKNVKKTST